VSLDPSRYARLTAAEIAAAVRGGRLSTTDLIEAALARIAAVNPRVNAFTTVTAERARARAAALDAAGTAAGPLAGVPYAVKNLFDIQGLPTLAGVEDQPRPCACGPRRGADREAVGGRRRAARCPQHGRVRL
jgi:hypothetical protein